MKIKNSCCFAARRPQRLQELHLQHNGVEAVGDQALAGLASLALLDLSGNRLHTMAAAALRPLLSLQVLRVTENPWRCDCALHWLRSWMDDEGRRLLSSSERRRLRCREPPRLSRLGLLEVPPNSLVCIPPLVQLEPRRMAVRLGDSLRVSCHASGYPRPQMDGVVDGWWTATIAQQGCGVSKEVAESCFGPESWGESCLAPLGSLKA
ncbi:leucine-rich repeat-containing protein 24-like isoform X1 [Syngnathus typhle]|uniref:leucine-rich repeat-containing protein 24-like isoform X1 n=1 Tax=Syngnathus typhle TaxID=161592 RepID=UPI002A69F440|nr:leucine-rich repeat-containing protein 24-like isoform X1 [Syngnathus typhle]